MKAWLEARRRRKEAEELLRFSRHLRHMRADILTAGQLGGLDGATERVRAALGGGGAALAGAIGELRRELTALAPARPFAGWRENIEILAVAIAIAMGCRTYFLQPFKIPTGSMQPTLYGIQTEENYTPNWTDRLPVKVVKWAVTGHWYLEVRARASGYLVPDPAFNFSSGQDYSFYVGNRKHRVPRDAAGRFTPGQFVSKGTVLWQGLRVAGDHVFVDKVRWNFGRPARGQIVVFSTEGIQSLQQGTHYIKRLVGLPGEAISIRAPYVCIGGAEVKGVPGMDRVSGGSQGYQATPPGTRGVDDVVLGSPEDVFQIPPRSYFVMGDNTGNSRDSRYWGSVPNRNMVGPAWVVYWPFSARWGWAR